MQGIKWPHSTGSECFRLAQEVDVYVSSDSLRSRTCRCLVKKRYKRRPNVTMMRTLMRFWCKDQLERCSKCMWEGDAMASGIAIASPGSGGAFESVANMFLKIDNWRQTSDLIQIAGWLPLSFFLQFLCMVFSCLGPVEQTLEMTWKMMQWPDPERKTIIISGNEANNSNWALAKYTCLRPYASNNCLVVPINCDFHGLYDIFESVHVHIVIPSKRQKNVLFRWQPFLPWIFSVGGSGLGCDQFQCMYQCLRKRLQMGTCLEPFARNHQKKTESNWDQLLGL